MLVSHKDLVRIVKELPEHRLSLIDLAWRMVREDGSLDTDRALLMVDEIEAANQEAVRYARASKAALWTLQEMARTSAPPEMDWAWAEALHAR